MLYDCAVDNKKNAGGNCVCSQSRMSGFTFLEVLIALVVLAVAGIGVTKLVKDGQDTLAKARIALRAEVVAAEQLLELDKDGLSSITARAGYDEGRGLFWVARAHATKTRGVYRLEVSVGMSQDGEPVSTMEKIFIQRF